MPSSSSTNAPKSVMLRTLPWTFEPTGYLISTMSHGFSWNCFIPRLMRFSTVSTPST